MRAWLPLVVLLGLVGCAADLGASAPPSARQSTAPPPDADEPARSARDERLSASGPHRSDVVVLDAVQLASGASAPRGFAVNLRGDVGLSAVFRTLRIWVFMEPVEGAGCGRVSAPSVLRPSDPDAMQPAIADETRTLIVRSRGTSLPGPGSWNQASFRYGPVPSLNGNFEGWLSFQFPESSDDPSCAFDVRGVVSVEAGERSTAVMPVVRMSAYR